MVLTDTVSAHKMLSIAGRERGSHCLTSVAGGLLQAWLWCFCQCHMTWSISPHWQALNMSDRSSDHKEWVQLSGNWGSGTSWDKTEGPHCAAFWYLNSKLPSNHDKWLTYQPFPCFLSSSFFFFSVINLFGFRCPESGGGVEICVWYVSKGNTIGKLRGCSQAFLLRAQSWKPSFYLGMDLGQCPEINTR